MAALRGTTVGAALRNIHCNTQSNEPLPVECTQGKHEVQWGFLILFILGMFLIISLCVWAESKGYIKANN